MENKVELKDVVQYYIGQKMLNVQLNETFILKGVNRIDSTVFVYHHNEESFYASTCKLILRPLTSLTDDEKVALFDIQVTVKEYGKAFKLEYIDNLFHRKEANSLNITTASFHYLLSIGIDLFNLLETNQAITV